MDVEHVDVLIVGAGVSGVGAAARLERDRSGTTYTVLEQRDAIGGTWDLFRYPGVRSDTDMFTFSYPFRPWTGAKPMGDGADIRDYIRDTATEYGVDRHVRFGTTVRDAAWSSAEQRWTVHAERDGRPVAHTARFLYLCTGYYDYDRGHQPDFAGLEDFRGRLVHPQFWPDDLDVAGQRVVVVGSGATAITLIPALAQDAAHVTMLQRSPSYVAVLPGIDGIADVLRRHLPAGLAHRLVRAKNVLFTQAVYSLCRTAPARARAVFREQALRFLGDPDYVDTHFRPAYEPWDQRLTLAPGGDFFRAVRDGQASVVTDRIDRFVPEGIRLASGTVLEADVVVSATGLTLKRFGGLALTVDGEPVDLADTVAYRALMLSGVPNLAFCFGYTNNSWTLRADLSARHLVRLLDHMDRHGHGSATPVFDPAQGRRPFISDLTAGYIRRGIDQFPDQGERGPWRVRQNYLLDVVQAAVGGVGRDVRFERRVADPDDHIVRSSGQSVDHGARGRQSANGTAPEIGVGTGGT